MNPWPYPRLFAHRGGGKLAPENTIVALQTGLRWGFSAVEFDVKLSNDGIAMLMHDEMLERTTNGHGAFRDRAAGELERLDAGAWFGAAFDGEPVPRFSQAMKFLHANGLNANIEIKPCPGREAETGQRVASMAEELTRDHVVKPLISSFSVTALRAAFLAAPALPRALLVEYYSPLDDAVLQELSCVSLNCRYESVASPMLEHLHGMGIRVMAYTVNDVSKASTLFGLGVDGLFTDTLDAMAASFPKALVTE